MITISRFKKQSSNERGNTILSVIISFGLMSIMSAAMMSMIENQRKQLKYIEQKEEIGDLKKSISLVLEHPSSCKENFDSAVHSTHTFNASATDLAQRKINLSQIKSGVGSTATPIITASTSSAVGTRLSSGLVIDKIEVVNLNVSSSTEYVGDIQVSFKQESGIPQLRPLTIAGQKFKVDAATPTSTKISDCVVTTPSSESAPTGTLPLSMAAEYNPQECYLWTTYNDDNGGSTTSCTGSIPSYSSEGKISVKVGAVWFTVADNVAQKLNFGCVVVGRNTPQCTAMYVGTDQKLKKTVANPITNVVTTSVMNENQKIESVLSNIPGDFIKNRMCLSFNSFGQPNGNNCIAVKVAGSSATYALNRVNGTLEAATLDKP